MKRILIILFCILISVPVVFPFFQSGYFPTHDGEWAVVRLGDMFRTLRDFQIPARYSGNLNFGYGYPLFNFTYPFPYYFGVFLHFFGFGFVNAIKFIFAISVFLSAFFMFLTSRELWKNTWAGIACSVLYIYFPYRMVDLYVRGSIGESLSFALFPLLFYLAIKLITEPSFLVIGGIAVSVAILIMSHNIMAVLFLPIYLVFTLILTILKNKKAVKLFAISILFGFCLSAFFWVPALFEKNNILLSQIPIADRNLYFVNFKQLIFPSWGYGAPIEADGFSYQLGLAQIVVFIIAILSLFSVIIKGRKHPKTFSVKIAFSLMVFIIFYVSLLFKSSEFLWENIPLLSEINYPWIILGILGFLISLLAGSLCTHVIGKYAVVILGIVSMIAVIPYAKPQYYINKGDGYYLTNDATTTSSNELMPLWVMEMPTKRMENKVEVVGGIADLKNISFNSKRIDLSVNASSQSLVRINTIYYPGWKATIDNKDTPISHANEKGVMDIHVGSGEHFIQVRFGETNLRLVSDIISVLSFFALAFLVSKGRKYEFS